MKNIKNVLMLAGFLGLCTCVNEVNAENKKDQEKFQKEMNKQKEKVDKVTKESKDKLDKVTKEQNEKMDKLKKETDEKLTKLTKEGNDKIQKEQSKLDEWSKKFEAAGGVLPKKSDNTTNQPVNKPVLRPLPISQAPAQTESVQETTTTTSAPQSGSEVTATLPPAITNPADAAASSDAAMVPVVSDTNFSASGSTSTDVGSVNY